MAFSKTQKPLCLLTVFGGFSARFVCAENTKKALKQLLSFGNFFSPCAATAFSVICAPRAISPLMNEVVEPRFFSNSNNVSVCLVGDCVIS